MVWNDGIFSMNRKIIFKKRENQQKFSAKYYLWSNTSQTLPLQFSEYRPTNITRHWMTSPMTSGALYEPNELYEPMAVVLKAFPCPYTFLVCFKLCLWIVLCVDLYILIKEFLRQNMSKWFSTSFKWCKSQGHHQHQKTYKNIFVIPQKNKQTKIVNTKKTNC